MMATAFMTRFSRYSSWALIGAAASLALSRSWRGPRRAILALAALRALARACARATDLSASAVAQSIAAGASASSTITGTRAPPAWEPDSGAVTFAVATAGCGRLPHGVA